jgi:hypothetical protein
MGQLALIRLSLQQPLDIVEARPLFQCLCYFAHRLFHVIQICLLADLLPQLVQNFICVSFGWQYLLDISNALILDLQSVIDTFKGQLDNIWHICPFRVRIKELLYYLR